MRYLEKKIIEEDVNTFLAIYNRWKEELFYRRHRTSFITTWTSTLFIAVIGGSLASSKGLQGDKLSIAIFLITIVWLVAIYYFIHNIKMHSHAKTILIELETKFTITKVDSSLFEIIYNKKPSQASEVSKTNFSEIGSIIQMIFVTLVAIISVVTLLIT